jgi:hypothetical protein
VVGEVASVVLKMRSFERERYGISNSSQAMLELAQTNNQENFGDIIKAHHVIHFVNCADPSELAAEFGRIGLCPRLEISPGRFAFWKPDEAVYSTKSTPEARSAGETSR